MEKTESLITNDSQICQYFQKFSTTKKDNFYWYDPEPRQITDFYRTMNDHYFQQKIQQNQKFKRKKYQQRNQKQELYQNIKNPITSSLPKHIHQDNMINVETVSAPKVQLKPMFTEVQCSKKKKNYVMAKEVAEMVAKDIQEQTAKKEQEFFRKKFPLKKVKSSQQVAIDNSKTEHLIREYNILLSKYKGEHLYHDQNLKPVDQVNYPEIVQDMVVDQQFYNVLTHFKKIYSQTKSQYITSNLLKYVLKFQPNDRFAKKTRFKQMKSHKESLIRQSVDDKLVNHQKIINNIQAKSESVSQYKHGKKNSIVAPSSKKVEPHYRVSKNKILSTKQLNTEIGKGK